MGAAQSFAELRLAYIHGLYLSTVLLALACIEQELAGLLHAAGWERARTARLDDLLSQAHERGVVTDRERGDVFEHLREVRNSYAHYRHMGHSAAWIRRAIDRDMPLDHVLEDDAWQAVQALGVFLRRRSGFA